MYWILTILIGMLPEVLFFSKFLEYSKNIKEHKTLLFIGILISYVLCILVSQYKILYYLCFIFLTYLILKIIYKKKIQIIDIFIISIAFMYIAFVGFIFSLFLKQDLSNYYFITIINRITLLIPFIFKRKFNNLYRKYSKLWNRNDLENRKIKSISLRNISLICLNLFVFLLNLAIINIQIK